jgi:biotin transport system substrate-specific component
MEAILKREVILNKIACRIIGVSAMIILTAVGAFVRIPLPFTPVPLTLQTLFVLLSAAFLGNHLGAITQISYVILGMSGLPIFAGAGSGLNYLLGPTGGYLFGFVLAAFFVGKFIKHAKDNLFSVLSVLFIGDLIILICGISWLKFLLGYSSVKLLSIGLIPFIPGDLLKAVFAASLYLKFKNRLKEIF